MFALPEINIFVIVMFLLFIIKYCINKFIKSNNKKAEVDKEDDEDLENYLSHEKYYNNVLSELEKMNVEVQDEDFSYKDSDIRTNTMSRMTDINNNKKTGVEKENMDGYDDWGDYLSFNDVFSESERMDVEAQDEDFSYENSDIKTNTVSRNSMTDINNNEKIGKDSHEEETNVKEQVNSVNNVRKITVL